MPRVVLPPQRPGLLMGLDLSACQRAQPPEVWDAIKEAGVGFCFFRAVDGVTLDRQLVRHAAGARRVGIPFGAYLVLEPRDNPDAEAKAFAQGVAALELELACVVDWELSAKGATCDDGIDHLDRLTDALALACTTTPMVYGSPNFLGGMYANASEQGREKLEIVAVACPLWVADYRGPEPVAPRPWDAWAAWQIGPAGSSIDGAPVDVNFAPSIFAISG